MSRSSVVVAALILTGAVSIAEAQIAPPTGGTGGLFGRRRPPTPNVVTQEVTVMVDVGSGHDTVTPDPEDQPAAAFFAPQYGTQTSGTAALNYRFGNELNFLEGAGQVGVSRATQGLEEIRTALGSFAGSLSSRDRYGIRGSVSASYEPAFLFGAFGPVANEDNQDVLDIVIPVQGVNSQRWLTINGNIAAYRGWTPKHRSEVRYTDLRREPINEVVVVPRNDSRMVTAEHAWAPRRTFSLMSSYSFQEVLVDIESGIEQKLRTHRARAGFVHTRRLAARRTLTLRMDGGVAQHRVETPAAATQFDFVVPTISGSARVDLTRSWSIGANLARDVNVLQGLTPEPFVANAVSVNLAGNISPRLQVAVSAAYSQAVGQRGRLSSFDNTASTAQMQFALTRQLAVFADYHYYDYRLVDVEVLQPGFPSRQGRNGVRVGMTFWLPLIGTF